jgi:hypothetical protein
MARRPDLAETPRLRAATPRHLRLNAHAPKRGTCRTLAVSLDPCAPGRVPSHTILDPSATSSIRSLRSARRPSSRYLVGRTRDRVTFLDGPLHSPLVARTGERGDTTRRPALVVPTARPAPRTRYHIAQLASRRPRAHACHSAERGKRGTGCHRRGRSGTEEACQPRHGVDDEAETGIPRDRRRATARGGEPGGLTRALRPFHLSLGSPGRAIHSHQHCWALPVRLNLN